MTDLIVPAAVPLKSVLDVELVAVGSWNASTGKATITDDDLRAAVAALGCPGIHQPVLKLGHMEPDPDATRIRWDGEPAVGWVANMRLSTNGAKLLGDYTGVPGWLVDVMPSAYPQRSVEIQRDFKCQVGHVHPFVITAVSLLGIYPPAVGVIKSLHDVQALYTLAAADGHPAPEVTRSIQARLAAAERRPLTDAEQRSGADFDRDEQEWDEAVAALLTAYGVVQRRQREQLAAQIASVVDTGRFDQLAALTLDVEEATGTIYQEMLVAAQAAIVMQVAEAAAQGVTGLLATPDEFYLMQVAEGIAGTMAASLAAMAGRSAAQLAAPGASGEAVARNVGDKLSDLSDQFLRDQLAGAIGAARASGRYSVLSVAPDGSYYASEVNDRNTCKACKAIDGTRFANLDAAMGHYGAGGYDRCEGRTRCRGRFVAVWDVAMGPAPGLVPIGLRVGDRVLFAQVAQARPPSARIVESSSGRRVLFEFDPRQPRNPDGTWTDGKWTKKPGAGMSDADLIKSKPWKTEDRKTVYTDEAELSAFRLLDTYAKVEPEITTALSAAAEGSGGRMEGLKHRLKQQESLARKIEQKSATKGLTMKQYAAKIGDALRYTMVLPSDGYGANSQQVIDDFRKRGYTVEVENTWRPGASYKGINTNVKKDGVVFEVQFHTPESLSTKHEVHGLYEIVRDASTSPEDRAALTEKMIATSGEMPTPDGAADVK